MSSLASIDTQVVDSIEDEVFYWKNRLENENL